MSTLQPIAGRSRFSRCLRALYNVSHSNIHPLNLLSSYPVSDGILLALWDSALSDKTRWDRQSCKGDLWEWRRRHAVPRAGSSASRLLHYTVSLQEILHTFPAIPMHPTLNVQNFTLIGLCDLLSGRCPSHSVGLRLSFRCGGYEEEYVVLPFCFIIVY